MTARPILTPAIRRLIGTVVTGAVLLAAIGFAGSYAAVRDLAEKQDFGDFALVFPIGIDAGIGVLLALDLVLTWLRMPYRLLRPTAWILTAATIAFNGASAWPDPLGVGMHAVIPLLFVVVVEAGRHAVGRSADITADKHMEGVRLTRWLLSPGPTFLIWRRMRLWELRSYDQAIQLERNRLIYRAQLQAQYGRSWRRTAPVDLLLPLRLARTGVPLPALDATPATPATPALATVAAPAIAPPHRPSPAVVPDGVRLIPITCATPADPAAHQERDTATPPGPAMQYPATPAAATAQHLIDTGRLLTVADVAAMRGVTTGTVRSWVSRGQLDVAGRDTKGRLQFDRDTVAAHATRTATPSQPTSPNHMEGGYA